MLRKLIFLVLAFWAVAAAANGNLPTIYIVTPGGVEITSREAWTPGASMEIVLPDGRKAFSSPNVEIRLRGHSTAGKPKKPYAIRLATAGSLLGMPAARRWQLLANFMDHSNMRNSLALAIARQTSPEWTPRSHMADLVVNGRPQGLYLLCEAITENPRRLAHIGRNGFIAEADTYFDSPAKFRTPTRNLPINIHNPKHPTARQLSAIESFFADIEAALYRDPSADLTPVFSKYIDKTSFADWLIVHELSQNAEPNGPRSCFFHRNGRGKLQAGPVWDFDLAFDNDIRVHPVPAYSSDDFLFKSGNTTSAGDMRGFTSRIIGVEGDRMRRLWNDARYNRGLTLEALNAFLDSMQTEVYESQKLNFTRWPIMNQIVNQNYQITGSYEGEMKVVRDFLAYRLAWMDNKIGLTPVGIERTKAGKATTPEAVPAEGGISVSGATEGAIVEVYDLAGARVARTAVGAGGDTFVGLGKGIYVVRITRGGETITNNKVAVE